jgi:O-antigen ligase
MGLAMGFMNVFPMLGYFIAKGINFKQLSGFLLWIILIHCIIGILLYPPFGFVDDSIFYVEKTTRLFGRMESVSGSLGFGCLLIIGFILSFFTDRRFLFITAFCLLLSMQRSAWIGALFAILIYIWEKMKQGYSREVMLLLVSCLLFVGFFYFISNYLNIDLEFMISRFERIGNATSERGGQWIAGLDNFLDYPLGTGIGQTGQFAARYEEVKSSFRIVADGDYFRILSEMGIVGGLFFIMLIIRCIFHLIKMRFRAKEEVAIIALTSAGLIQMIGSNISEFYFTNFLFWMIIGYFFIVINEHNKIHCNDIHLHGNL